jgi:hypothetical protein
MGGAYSMHHRGEKCTQNFGLKIFCFSAGFLTNLNKESVLTLMTHTHAAQLKQI